MPNPHDSLNLVDHYYKIAQLRLGTHGDRYDELCDLIAKVKAEGVARTDAARSVATSMGLPWRNVENTVQVCCDPRPPRRFFKRSWYNHGTIYVTFRDSYGPWEDRPWPSQYMWK